MSVFPRLIINFKHVPPRLLINIKWKMTYTYLYICYSFRNLFVYFLSQRYFLCINSSPEDNGATLERLNIALISILIELISFNMHFGNSYGNKLYRKFHTWAHACTRAYVHVISCARGSGYTAAPHGASDMSSSDS